jgi:hypothetical protein
MIEHIVYLRYNKSIKWVLAGCVFSPAAIGGKFHAGACKDGPEAENQAFKNIGDALL